jgi:Flp pilus assembly protein TadG
MFWTEFKHHLTRFRRNQQGSVAIIFGVAIVAVMVAAGVAVDFGRSVRMQSELQRAADSGVLAAARASMEDQDLNITELTAVARQYFDQNDNAGDGDLTIQKFQLKKATVDGEEGFELSVTAQAATTMMGVVGIQQLNVDILSRANAGVAKQLELVMVLDTTASMGFGTKMDDLKTAANGLVDILMPAGGKYDNVNLGVVPFARYVNIGLASRHELWTDVPADYQIPQDDYCYTPSVLVTPGENCTTTTSTCTTQDKCTTKTTDGVSVTTCGPVTTCSGGGTTCEIPPVYEPGEEVCTPRDPIEVKWNGCAGSRNHDLNVTDRDYTLNPVPGIMSVSCPSELLQLTNNRGHVIASIDSMSPSDNTFIATGAVWGWRVISPGVPYETGQAYELIAQDKLIKAMVLMADGMNTVSPNYSDGKHSGSDTAASNDLLAEVCTNAKAEGILIFSVAFDVTDTTIKDLLQNCATTPDNYYDASSGSELQTAFSDIANSLLSLRLTR